MSLEIQLDSAFPDRMATGFIKKGVVLGASGGFGLDTRTVENVPTPPADHPIVKDVHTNFTLFGFEEPRAPFTIGRGDLSKVPKGTEFFGLPIKFPGTEYRVPNELASVSDVLTTSAAFEEELNPYLGEYYAYISLYRTYVDAGERQLTAGLHSDGIQGRRIEPKVPIEHGYAITDSDPTDFFPQAFDMTDVDVNKHLLDAVFEAQVDRSGAVHTNPGEITVFDAYCVHQAVPASEAGWRTFMKLMYTPRQYDRDGNGINQLFVDEYEREGWVFDARPIPGDLTVPTHLQERYQATAMAQVYPVQ